MGVYHSQGTIGMYLQLGFNIVCFSNIYDLNNGNYGINFCQT